MQKGKSTISSWRNSNAGMANGLSTFGKPESAIVGAPTRIETDARTRTTPQTHANHRHRGDGRWPSGNSNRVNVPIRPIGGTHSMSGNASVHVSRGRRGAAAPPRAETGEGPPKDHPTPTPGGRPPT